MKSISVTSIGGPEALHVLNEPEPEYAPDEVLVRTAFVGVGNIDMIMRRGGLGDNNPKPPFTPGLEVSGEIIAVGKDVTNVNVGDKVTALLLLQMGGYAELVRCKASSIVKLPEELALASAASIVNPTTALRSLLIVQPQPGEKVIVHGAAGGLGGVIGRVAKIAYPDIEFIGVVRTEDKKDFAREAGYNDVLTTDEFTASLRQGRHYEIVIDPVGGDLRRSSLNGMTPRGRMLLLGNVTQDVASNISSQEIWLKSLTVSGFNLGYLNSVDPDTVRKTAEEIVEFVANKQLDLTPTKVFAFDQVQAAHDYLESGDAHGRVVLETGQ